MTQLKYMRMLASLVFSDDVRFTQLDGIEAFFLFENFRKCKFSVLSMLLMGFQKKF